MHQESMRGALPARRGRGVTALIASGSAMFVFGLAVSAAFAPEWRVLHVLQALIYVVLIALARRRSAWGFGAGLFVALFWNSLGIVATRATLDGMNEVMSVVRTGHVQRPDLLLTLLATLGHVLIIIGCVIGIMRLQPKRREWAQFLAGGVIGLGYLLAIVFAFGPPQAIELMRHVFGG